MRAATAVLLLLLGLQLACEAGGEDCPSPSDRQSRYPFSGIFVADSTATQLCLYQEDVRTVQGRLDGARAVGKISRDGTLTLAVGTGTGADLYSLSLSGDTLRVTRALTTTGTELRLPDGRLVRTSGE